MMNICHNHEPSLHPSSHSTRRKLNSEQVDTVRNVTLSGVKLLGILSSLLMENDGALANLSTLYNKRTKLRKYKVNGRTPIQALFDDLQASNLTHFHRCDDGAITSLFCSQINYSACLPIPSCRAYGLHISDKQVPTPLTSHC